MDIKNVAMVGLGAIGTTYARRIIKVKNIDFAVVADGKRAERIRKNGETINGEKIMPNVVEPNEQSWKADLVIFTVKNYQLQQALTDVKNIVTENTVFLTVLNGVTARDEIKAFYPDNTVLYGIGMGIDAVRNGGEISCKCEGTIQFGEAENKVLSPAVKAVKEVFDLCGVGNEVFDDMIRTIWNKFMINVKKIIVKKIILNC